jgi:hypothetical protein
VSSPPRAYARGYDCRPFSLGVPYLIVKRLRSILKSTRLWGLLGTGAIMYFLVFVVFGKVDVSWIMPDTKQIARTIIDVWPKMPFFVQTDHTAQGDVTYYTVSTHQLTRQELKQMGVTNAVAAPAKPK